METTNFETQNPIPDIQIPVLPSTPTPNRNIFKILFFIFLGLFLIISSIYLYLWVKSDQQSPNSQAETQNQITKNITPIETKIPTSIPTIVTNETQDWKTYTDSTYNYSIQYPKTWKLTVSSDKDLLLTTPEYEEKIAEIKKSGIMAGEPDGSYDISCFKNIKEYAVTATQKNTEAKSLSDYFTGNIPDEYSLINKTTINNFNTYEVEMGGMGDGQKSFFIENTNSYFCVISLKNKELNDNENQFINTFKFN